ncbi:MAG TPA: hypothetical protein VK741_21805 [Acetobacteraceae bacterium]|jgi:biotin operon repressor|nr:hypothetical protein [Acetobacteraceae bacterium]
MLNRPQDREGRARRAAITRWLLPRLHSGQPVPPIAPIGWALGISRVAAWKHVRRVLREQGITVTREGRNVLIVQGREPRPPR